MAAAARRGRSTRQTRSGVIRSTFQAAWSSRSTLGLLLLTHIALGQTTKSIDLKLHGQLSKKSSVAVGLLELLSRSMSRRSRPYGRLCLSWRRAWVPISVPENRTQGAAISGVSRIIKLPVAYAFSVILRVAQGGAAYSPVLKCTIIVKNSIPPRFTFFLSARIWTLLRRCELFGHSRRICDM